VDFSAWEEMADVPDAAPDEGTPVAETEAPAPEMVADTAEEQAQDGRPRDEHGRFVSTKDEPVVEAEQQEAERLLAGKYKTVEELERAYQSAESRLGQSGSELGELRQAVQELRAQLQPQEPQYNPETLQEWFDQNPHQVGTVASNAAQQVLEGNQGAQDLLDAALVAWGDLDPVGAKRFERQFIAAQVRAEQTQMTSAEAQATRAWNDAAQQFAQDHPDMNQFAPKMMELADQSPAMVRLLQDPNPGTRLEALDYLYTKAKAAVGDTLQAAKVQVDAEAAQAVDQAIQDATVASATTTNPQDPNKRPEDILEERMRRAMPFAFDGGWSFGNE
jgi:hypothetical protein